MTAPQEHATNAEPAIYGTAQLAQHARATAKTHSARAHPQHHAQEEHAAATARLITAELLMDGFYLEMLQ